MAYPSPSFPSNLLFYWDLVGFLPQVYVADLLWPMNSEDSSETGVDEGLDLLGGGLFFLHVSEPYRRTAFTLELKILIFVCLLTSLDFQRFLSSTKAALALPILVFISSAVPPCLSTMLPR